MTIAPSYTYWQTHGGDWADEYRRRQRRQPMYGLQELVLAAILEANAPARVLEFGCGVGRHLSYVTTIAGIEAHAVDQSPTMLDGLPQWVADPVVAARVHLIEPTGRLPFEAGSFDLVYTAEVLVHVAPADIADRVAELVRVARRAIIHLEPPADYPLAATAHDGCWYHDLVELYAGLGITAHRIGRPIAAQELIVAMIDPARPLTLPGPTVLRHMRRVETWLDAGLSEATALPPTEAPPATPLATQFADADERMKGDDKIAGSETYFPTQQLLNPARTTIADPDRRYGAPFDPVPAAFRAIPAQLEICVPLAREEELGSAAQARAPFAIPLYPTSYMHDVVRAFRLIRGRRTYLEVGTFDRGNLAYAASLLADDALLIGVDMQAEDERDARLGAQLKPDQRYVAVVGDSRDPQTVSRVRKALDGRTLEAAFIDGGHTAHAVMCDYVNYGGLVGAGGVIMFHDSLWEGNATFKGSADALAEIDRFDPIYLVAGEGAPHRFMRPLWRDEIWGIVGLHLK